MTIRDSEICMLKEAHEEFSESDFEGEISSFKRFPSYFCSQSLTEALSESIGAKERSIWYFTDWFRKKFSISAFTASVERSRNENGQQFSLFRL